VRTVPLIWDGYCRYENRCVFAHGLAELEKFSTQVRTDCCLPPPQPPPHRRWEKALGVGCRLALAHVTRVLGDDAEER
jgi:hypothetical protein